MSNDNTEASAPKRGKALKLIVIAAVVLVALPVATFFVVTSGGFLKSVVLPKVGAAVNADLAVGSVELSPFSQLVLRNVKLTPKGKDTLLTANLVRARYDLLAILRGNISVQEVTVESPTVTLVQNADGSSNLDPLLQGGKAAPKSESKSAADSAAPPQLDIQSVALKNATIKVTRNLEGGERQVIDLANVNLNATNLKNGSSGKLDLSAGIALDSNASNLMATANARLNGDFTFDLTPDLLPAKLNGQATFKIERAGGAFADFAALGVALDADASPTEIKQLALRFTQSGQALGEVRVHGPFDAAKTEGKLNVAVLSLDRRVLNLAGAASGIDFGTTLVNATNVIELTQAGSVISATGQLNASRVQITREGQTTPTLDLRCGYAVQVDNTAKSAQIRTLNLAGTQDSRPLLQTELTSPMTIAWGNAANAVGDATLNVTLTRLNLADWRTFAPDLEPAGTVSATLKLLSQQAGKQLAFDLDANAIELAAKLGSNSLHQADVSVRLRGNATDLKQIKLDDYLVALAQRGQSVARVSGSGTFDTATQDADLQVALQATLARLLGLFPQPDAEFSSGNLQLDGRLTSKAESRTFTGKLALTGLTGKLGDLRFAGYGSTADLNVGMKGDELQIHRANGELHEGANPGGTFGVSGNFNTASKAGQFALALTNFNQNALRPFLESALGDKKLVSVTLDTTATAKLEANGDAEVKANAQLANLVVNDPTGAIPNTPLEAKLAVDAGVAKSVAQLRQCQLTLTPTERAKNELTLTGSVDYSRSNAISGNLKLASDSLDLTRYYDLFAGDAKAKSDAKPTAQPPASGGEKEPEPVKLPFSNFSFAANVGKFFLREVEATSFQFTTKLDGSRVLVNPAQFVLNGAPVNATADLDLGVPGYKYDVRLNASPIPLAPLVNSFVPERKDQLKGVTLANANFKGAGVTGASLRQNLNGEFSFASTNLDLAIPNLQSKLIKEVVNVIVGIPDLVRNPAATLGNLITRLTGGNAKGGFAQEVMSRPIESIVVRARAAGGKIMVEQADIHSSAFQASTTGEVALADVLTNSAIRFPIHVALSRPLAEKAGLAGGTPTNQPMVSLPDFLTIKGTLGDIKKDINALTLVALAAKAGSGIAVQTGTAVGEQVGNLLNTLTGLAGGNNQAAPNTNVPPGTATNAPPAQGVGDLLRGLGGLIGGQKQAAPTTNQPAPPK